MLKENIILIANQDKERDKNCKRKCYRNKSYNNK